MKSLCTAAICLAVLLAPAAAFAQGAGAGASAGAGEGVGGAESPEIAVAELEAPVNPFLPGSQSIGLGAGLQVPFLALPADETGAANFKLGGSLSISYNYFVARGLSLGGTLSGAFTGTIAGRSLFIAPLSFTVGYWWSVLPLDLCVEGSLGGYLMRLDQKGMLGPFLKVGGGAFWRTTSAWSIGIQPFVWVVPEIHVGDYSELTRVGAFLETSITAVYHL
ncbi:MAG: hypothetical protein Q8M76_05735 [Spirochaetaceae bacterium]|nr:hypothetical protein [Spirochaetaceae bacterium]